MINALVFGRNGQLARSLALIVDTYPDIALHFVDRGQCDLTHPERVAGIVDAARPDIVINAAAYTAVDQAESEPDIAQVVNCDAVREMARAANRNEAPFIHFSTDYVFDGNGRAPYREDDAVAPLGVYGKTKLAGEDAVRSATERHLILRTAWVYSPYGRNFVKTMLGLMESRDEIGVVNDQLGCPTSSLDLATATLRVLPDIVRPGFTDFGTCHLVGNDQMTWFEFAQKIQQLAVSVFGPEWPGKTCTIKPVTTDQFPTAAKRPAYSVMATDRFTEKFGFSLPTIETSLTTVLQKLAKG